MTPAQIANEAAEAVFRQIEDTKRINKSEIADAIEGVLMRHQPRPSYACFDTPRIDEYIAAQLWGANGAASLCGND